MDVTGTLREWTAYRYRYVVTAAVASPHLDIRLLGPPEILVDGAPLVVDTRKAVAILALLGSEGRAFARDELAAMLWPDADQPAAHGALRRTLSTLRAATGDSVMVDRTKVALAPAGVRVDVAELERLAGSDARRSLAAAAGLARGPFLAGFNLRDSADFDDWRAGRAVALERTVMRVLDRLAGAHEAAGDLSAAIGAASRRLDLDLLDEAGHVRLMDLFARSGDRAAALRQYRSCVAILDRELGVAPLASTTARYEAIRDADIPTEQPTADARPDRFEPPTAGDVSTGATRLVGRDFALSELLTAYASVGIGPGRIAAITGEAGIGKTMLGDAVVDHIRGRGGTVLHARAYVGERGIAYGPIVDLLRAAVADPAAIERLERSGARPELARLLPAVDPDRRRGRDRADGPGAHSRLLSAIADGLAALTAGPVPGCLWIDDLSWADGETLEALAYLIRRLTDRPLFLLAAWRPEDLDEATMAFVQRLGAPPALIVELARLDRVAVAELAAPTTSDPAVIDRLLEASEGLPLYVVEALAAGDLEHGTMPLGVRAMLRSRLATAGETAAQVLAAASVIGRSFDLGTVRHASGRSEGETVDALDESLRRGLIREVGAGFDFVHGGLRDVAYESTSQTRRRLLHRRVADTLRLDLARSGRDDLVRLALIAAHERDGGRALEAAEAFRLAGARAAELFANREAIEHDEAALSLGHPDIVGLHSAIGRLRTRLGDYADAITALETAAALAGAADLPELERLIAGAQLRRGDLLAASRHLEAALDGASGTAFQARVLVEQSVVKRLRGDLTGAHAAASRALEEAIRADDDTSVGAAHRSLGLLALASGDVEAATIESHRALDVTNENDPTAKIAALTGLALAEAAGGDHVASLHHGAMAVNLCRMIGDRHLEAAVENHLADILHAAGREDESMVHLRQAVEAFAEVGGDPADPDPGIWMLSVS